MPKKDERRENDRMDRTRKRDSKQNWWESGEEQLEAG